MMMLKKLLSVVFMAVAAVSASAQQRPLSPPERPPVPLTNEDQERARLEELNKKKMAEAAALQKSGLVKVPAVLAGHHISSGNPSIDSLVHEAAGQNGLDPCLVLSVMRAESAFNRTAVSVKGASGLMQLMPATATRFGVKNIFDPRENVMGGTRYLRWLLNRFGGDVRLALAGYNAGEGAVEFYGYRIPPYLETQNYVRLIYSRYSNIHLGSVPAAPAVEAIKAVQQSGDKNPTYNQIIRFTSSTGDAARSSN